MKWDRFLFLFMLLLQIVFFLSVSFHPFQYIISIIIIYIIRNILETRVVGRASSMMEEP